MRANNSYAAVAAAVAAVVFSAAFQPASARAVTIDWATVGNPGNANDTTGFGGVNYDYQIGKYHVTIGQYTDFLNAVAKTDTYSLYNTSMATDLTVAGISRTTGTSGEYSYGVIAASGSAPFGGVSGPNRPITFVSWWDAARFANWLENGQPTGAQSSSTTENGSYNLNGATSGNVPARNAINPNTGAVAKVFIPTENEWYKSAYYAPPLNSGSGGYYTYATQSNSAPNNRLPSVAGSTTNEANFYAWSFFGTNPSSAYAVTRPGSNAPGGQLNPNQNYLTDVGAFSNSPSYYGTFDQSGLVYQWNDLDGTSSANRGIRGGWWNDANPVNLSKNTTFPTYDPTSESRVIGMRVALVPEPSTYAMALAGLACGAWQMARRRRAR